MSARRFDQVDLFAPVSVAKAATPSRAEDPRTPHIKQFSDGYRVWNPMVRNYVGDAHMQPFRDIGAASVLQRALYMEMAASGTAPAKVMRRAEAMRAEGSDLFGASAAVRPTGEQRGFKFNGAMAASKANPFVVVDKRGRREIPAVFTSRKEAGLARGYLEAAEGARGLRVRATTPAERARKRNGASRVPPPRSLIHVEILAGGYGGTTDPTARITRFTAVTPLEGYGKKARSHRFPIDELVARAAGGRVVLDGKKVVGVVFTNADRNDSGASVATRAVASLAQELYGDPTVLRAQVDYAKRNDVRRSRAPEPSFDPYAYGRPIYAEEARPAKPSRRSAEDYEAISMLKPNGVTRKRNGMDFSYASEPIIDEDGRVDPTDVRWVVRDESGDIDASFNDHSYGRGVPGYQPEKWARLWASLRNAGHGREQTREKVREVWAVDAAETQRWLAERRKSNPGRTLPATVERCVAHVGPRRVEELGEREGLSSAIAICTAQGQRTGQLRKGTRTPTKKGSRDARNARRRVGFAEDERAVARMARGARKGNAAKKGPLRDAAWSQKMRDLPRRVGTGKTVGLSLYLHESAVSLLPREVISLVSEAESIASPAQWNVLKIDLARPKIGFSLYPDFWTSEFPSLTESWSVDLETGRATHRLWSGDDPWILHRKETMLAGDDERAVAPRKRTQELERLGAFAGDSSRIGKRSVWENRPRGIKQNPPVEPSRAYSAATSLRQVPALHRAIVRENVMPRGSVNADIGGGRYDDATHFFAEHGITNLVYEPSRGAEWNQRVLARIGDGGAESATIANVLNVIPDAQVRREVLGLARNVVRRGGNVWVSIYEGDGKGHGKETPKGWQENRRLRTYLPEVLSVFPDARVVRVGGVSVILATAH